MAKSKLQFLSLNHILKWKDCQVDPLGHCFRSSLRGIKQLKPHESLNEWRMNFSSEKKKQNKLYFFP